DESPCPFSRVGGTFARQLDFDHAVLKFSLIQNHKLNSVGDICRRGVSHAQRFSPLVCHQFRFHIAGLHLVRIVQGNVSGLCETRTRRQRHNSDEAKHRLSHQSAPREAQVLAKFLHKFPPSMPGPQSMISFLGWAAPATWHAKFMSRAKPSLTPANVHRNLSVKGGRPPGAEPFRVVLCSARLPSGPREFAIEFVLPPQRPPSSLQSRKDHDQPFYSSRSATTGSTFVARRAGM